MARSMSKSTRGAFWAGIVASLALASSPAAARILYVRAGGNDGLDGSTPAAALRTIARATALVGANDDIVVGPGIYHEGDLRPAVFGHVRFVADRRGTTTGDPPGDVVVDATGFVTGFELNGQLGVSIDGFVIYGASIGVYVKSGSHQAVLSNNIVSNCGTNGIYLQDSRDAVVFNNLVYNNASTGMLVTGNVSGSADAVIVNNTVYGNGNRGIFFSGTTIGSPNGLVLNNIVVSSGSAGLQVNAISRPGYVSAGNVLFDNRFASGTPIDVTDMEADPLFVNPVGADGILGGPAYADDSFHLSDQRAGQAATSAAIDAGSDVARRLLLYRSSTRTDGKPDRRYVDAGYHYDNYDAPPPSPGERLRTRRLYVSATRGSDTNDGATRATAVGTLTRALALARPGHQITLLGGTYREGEVVIGSTASGKPGRPVVLKGMGRVTIDAGGAQRGLTLTSVSNVIVEGVAVTGALDNGIEVRNSAAADPDDPSSYSVVLRSCRLFGNGKRGLSIRNSTRVLVRSCRVEDNGARGIQIENSDARVEHSIVSNNGTTGLWAFNGSTVAVDRSSFVDNPQEGVLVEGSALSMHRGTLRGGTEGGARFKAESTGVLDAVVIVDNEDLGVQVDSSTVRIVGSTMRRNRIGVLGSIDAELQVANEIAIEDSIVCDSAASGVDVQNTALTLRNTTVYSNGAEGLRQTGGSTDIDGCRFEDNAGRGASVTGATLVEVQDVVVARNGNNGIQVVGAGGVRIATGEFLDNVGDGVAILDSSVQEVSQARVERNGSIGIHILRNTNSVTAVQMIGNTVSGNGREGLRQSGGAVHIEGGGFEDNATVGVSLSGVTQATMLGILVADNLGDGLQIEDGGARIERSTVRDNGRTGLWAFGGSSVSIDRTDFLDNPSQSLLVEGSDLSMFGGTLSGSTEGGARFLAQSSGELQNVIVTDNQDTGVQVLSSTVSVVGTTIQSSRVGVLGAVDSMLSLPNAITIDDSIICECGASGVDVQDTTMTLTDAVVCSNGDDGLRQKGGSIDIDGGTFSDNAGRGVSVADAEHVTARDIAVARNRNNGFQVVSGGSVSLRNGEVFDNLGDGVTVLNSAVREVIDSRVYRNGSTGILILENATGLSALQVIGNSVYGNGQEGFRLTGGGAHFEDGSFEDNASDGVSLAGAEQVTARDIVVARNRGNGFEVVGAGSVSIVNGVLAENAGDGLTILDSPSSEVSNGLIYRNGSTGILISGSAASPPAARVVGSTVYGNTNRGLFVSADGTVPPSTEVVVMRNIFRNNGNAGIQVSIAPLVQYSGDYNLSTDPYGALTPVGSHDILLDPALVDPGAGNFRLSQPAAGQSASSPAVDAGGMSAAAAGMSTMTTRTDSVPDAGVVDIGYHYPPPTPAPAS